MKNKWFENKVIVLLLLFTVPPVGIYGMLQRDSKVWKKVIYTIIGLFTSLWLMGLFLMVFFPTDHYEIGNTLLNKGQYSEAINEYEKVENNNDSYKNALAGIGLANKKIDSIENHLKQLGIDKENKLKKDLELIKLFQNKWADSIIKTWEGDYIKNYKTTPQLDTIYFQLNRQASKGNWKSTSDLHRSSYQKQYDSLTKTMFDEVLLKTEIVITPDSKQQKINEKKARRKHLINRQFSPYDHSHRKLKEYLKNNMNDPSTFEHVETTYTDKGSYLYIYMKFRGSNSFGATVLSTIRAKVDLEGNILSTKMM